MTVDQLVRHARRFGTEGVIDAAVDGHLPFEELVRLQEHLDEIDQEKRGRRYVKPRKTAEQRIKKLLGIEEDSPSERA